MDFITSEMKLYREFSRKKRATHDREGIRKIDQGRRSKCQPGLVAPVDCSIRLFQCRPPVPASRSKGCTSLSAPRILPLSSWAPPAAPILRPGTTATVWRPG